MDTTRLEDILRTPVNIAAMTNYVNDLMREREMHAAVYTTAQAEHDQALANRARAIVDEHDARMAQVRTYGRAPLTGPLAEGEAPIHRAVHAYYTAGTDDPFYYPPGPRGADGPVGDPLGVAGNIGLAGTFDPLNITEHDAMWGAVPIHRTPDGGGTIKLKRPKLTPPEDAAKYVEEITPIDKNLWEELYGTGQNG